MKQSQSAILTKILSFCNEKVQSQSLCICNAKKEFCSVCLYSRKKKKPNQTKPTTTNNKQNNKNPHSPPWKHTDNLPKIPRFKYSIIKLLCRNKKQTTTTTKKTFNWSSHLSNLSICSECHGWKWQLTHNACQDFRTPRGVAKRYICVKCLHKIYACLFAGSANVLKRFTHCV